ncbi:MAG: response regulator transcription factor [Deltaproteobacteria bacterium]|nr:response regulator transcription factor [Deltaproteobacteria bacterium]
MARVLIVDDEEDLLDVLDYNLGVSGYVVDRAQAGWAALELAEKNAPDLILLDVMLPDLHGFEVLRILRTREKTRYTPVIMLTARGEEADVLVGFELGADDYVTKPFSPRALLARVRAVLKRSGGDDNHRPRLRFDDLEVDLDAHRVFLAGEEIVLAPQEFRLLAFLVKHPNRVYTREQLLSNAWDQSGYVDPRTVDVHIRRLRSRIESDPSQPCRIETVRGAGYRFNPTGGLSQRG